MAFGRAAFTEAVLEGRQRRPAALPGFDPSELNVQIAGEVPARRTRMDGKKDRRHVSRVLPLPSQPQ